MTSRRKKDQDKSTEGGDMVLQKQIGKEESKVSSH